MTDILSGVNGSTAAFAVTDEYGQVQPSGPVTVGNDGSYSFMINLQASRNGNDMDGRLYRIKISAQDNAGNPDSATTTTRLVSAQVVYPSKPLKYWPFCKLASEITATESSTRAVSLMIASLFTTGA